MPQFRGTPTVKFGDIQSPQALVRVIQKRLEEKLKPEFLQITEWYKQEVAKFQYTYFDGYPMVHERLRPIILDAKPSIRFVIVGTKIQFHIKVFDDSPGGYLDQATHTGRGNLGWWRYFEEGAPNQRNFGSNTHGFIVTGRKEDGRPDGFMVPAYSRIGKGGKLYPRPHPGVFRVGVFEATWNNLKSEFTQRIAAAVQRALLEI